VRSVRTSMPSVRPLPNVHRILDRNGDERSFMVSTHARRVVVRDKVGLSILAMAHAANDSACEVVDVANAVGKLAATDPHEASFVERVGD